MRNLKGMAGVACFAILLTGAAGKTASGQERVFQWLPANDETARLDPADFHTGRVYRPGPGGGNIHVGIKAQQPVTIEMTASEDWDYAQQHSEALPSLRFFCAREHVVDTTYTCELPPGMPTVLIVRDERNLDRAVFAGLGAIIAKSGPGRQFVAPNELHIQYYRWACVENCNPPQIRWFRQMKEKYELTAILKIYGGLTPQRDGEQVSVKIKAPVPMAVAILPLEVADRLHQQPETFEKALAGSACKQRGIQSMTFQCTFDVVDGPQSLVVVPEPGVSVPNHKKAEIEVLAARCVANCVAPPKPQTAQAQN